jgi:uncharacterized protein (DUF1697 family)
MARYVGLLRGINVGGKHKISMATLRGLVEELGHTEVSTVLQSGNVVFTAAGKQAAIGPALERVIAAEMGASIRVLVRSRAQIAKVISGNPLREAESEPSKLLVGFVDGTPDRAAVAALEDDPGPEEVRVTPSGIYIWFREGIGRSQLAWDKRLGVPATARNWNTVAKIATALDGG